MKTSDFDYDLPEELIAQHPLEKRDSSRLLTLDKHTGAIEHHHFYELPQFLRPGDCLVLNDSRVLPARLIGHRLPGGGVCEVLLLVDKGEDLWECLVRPGRKMRTGAQLSFGEGELTATVEAEIEDGKRLVRFHYEGIFLEVLERLVDVGNTVLVIEHNLDVIKMADRILDMGPEGGNGGGTVVAYGTPEQVAKVPESHTGRFLAPILERDRARQAAKGE